VSAPVPRLTVVIPVRGRPDVLSRVLDDLGRQTVPPGTFEVVVVADADDADAAAIRSATEGRDPPLRCLVEPGLGGVSEKRNLGWREARAPLILFLGADILAAPDLVAEHLAWHERNPADEIGVLGDVRWARELRVTPFMRWLEDGVQFDYPGIEGGDAGWGRFYTANVSVKRAMLERVGGFDEDFPFMYEDLEVAYRMHAHGFRLLYHRGARAEHLHPTTVEDWRERVADIAVAERRLVERYPELDPYFFQRFSRAAARPRARGRGIALARFVPRGVPVLGPYVWNSVHACYDQELAASFLEAWQRAEAGQR
jgi:GT2 family glycosyltransferase